MLPTGMLGYPPGQLRWQGTGAGASQDLGAIGRQSALDSQPSSFNLFNVATRRTVGSTANPSLHLLEIFQLYRIVQDKK